MFFFPRFHPTNNDSMASGSTDGLVNVFDLSQGKVNKIRRTIFNYIIDSTGATGSAGIFVRIHANEFFLVRRLEATSAVILLCPSVESVRSTLFYMLHYDKR